MRKIFIIALVIFQSFYLNAEMNNNADDSLANDAKAMADSFESKHFIFWYQPRFISLAVIRYFSEKYENAYDGIEKIISRSFDSNHFQNQKIQVFLTKGGVSHVYGGYYHADYNKSWIYLPALMVKENNSFYSHELTHIIAWKSSAHSLREGLACWMQIKLSEDGIGLNTKTHGFTNRSEADKIVRTMFKENNENSIFESIGTPGIPSSSLTKVGGDSRSNYYTACYSFVSFLLDSINMNEFMKLYEAEDLPKISKNITKKDMNEWKKLWIKYLASN